MDMSSHGRSHLGINSKVRSSSIADCKSLPNSPQLKQFNLLTNKVKMVYWKYFTKLVPFRSSRDLLRLYLQLHFVTLEYQGPVQQNQMLYLTSHIPSAYLARPRSHLHLGWDGSLPLTPLASQRKNLRYSIIMGSSSNMIAKFRCAYFAFV